MADICILGTGGTLPKVERHLSSVLFRHNGQSVLFDCGEGTQIALKKAGFTFKPIDVICISHFHADHVSGLPGFMLTMGNEGREDPVTIVIPQGGERIVRALLSIAPDLPFEVIVKEYVFGEAFAHPISDHVTLYVAPAEHTVPCIAFSLQVRRDGRFDTERALANGVPKKLWNVIRREGLAEQDGKVYYAADVMGEERKGIKFTYITDTRPTDTLVSFAADSDMLVCEGMFGDPEKIVRAEKTQHMTFSEAAELAKRSGVEKLVLTHFSPSLPEPEEYADEVRGIFSDTVIATDGMTFQVNFESRNKK